MELMVYVSYKRNSAIERGAKPDASFDRRQGNSVQYWTPTWAGVSFRVQHSVNEGQGAIVAGGPVVSPIVNSVSAVWSWRRP